VKLIDLCGQRFGRLLVLARAPNRGRRVSWCCRCDCGKTITVTTLHLRGGDTQSCGCRAADVSRANIQIAHAANTAHGHCVGGYTPTYRSWANMRSRCENSGVKEYADYGGRGIRVCTRWQSFENFLLDMGERPADLTLDRVDNNGNYEPRNCRWATRRTQQNNRRRNSRLTFAGETLSLSEWSRRTSIPLSTLRGRLRLRWTAEQALSKPVRIRR
jgi:hypothetical protein